MDFTNDYFYSSSSSFSRIFFANERLKRENGLSVSKEGTEENHTL